MRPVTWVIVEEVKSGDWGIAGNPLSTADVKALAAGAPVRLRGARGPARAGPRRPCPPDTREPDGAA
jgi:hypothetical protein